MFATLDFEAASLKDLQAAARDKSRADGKATTWIAGARKDTLLAYLTGEGNGEAAQEPAQKPAQSPPKAAQIGAQSDLAALIAQAVAPHVQGSVNADDVRAIVADEVAKLTLPKPVEIRVQERDAVTFNHAHEVLPKVVQAAAAGLHVWLTGPAGSGKTTIAEQAAEALGLEFRCLSVSAQTPLSALMGYMNATGDYVRTPFRDMFEHGGLFILDEVDAGNPNVLAALNAALANGICSFADANVKRHENFRVIACANTWGTGATSQYVGRLQIDAATLNRFVRLSVAYDEALEAALCSNPKWLECVRRYRKAAESLRLNVIVSPRASFYGASLLAAGWSEAEAEAALIFAGLSEDATNKLKGAVNHG
jgi:cobaltochelatase CobS